MTEQVPEPRPPEYHVLPVEPDAELAHRNNVVGLALFGLFLLLFAGTWLIAFIYLAVD
ncbi:MAG TPA: hypothetical protein VNB86_00925 [Gaiellaceae bacterium]|jgi:hypothetical protein|nr:hypothetical protein [Gaiellaceae bacterium]